MLKVLFVDKATWQLDLLQVDLTSFLASGASFLGREPSKRATKSREVRRILNRTKDFFERLRDGSNFAKIVIIGSNKRVKIYHF